MSANFTLDEMILHYSENPFIDERLLTIPAITDTNQKRKVLGRLLLIAGNLFGKDSLAESGSYKRRYELK